MARAFSALGTFKCLIRVFGWVSWCLPCGMSYPCQASGATLPFWQQQSLGFASWEKPDMAGDMIKPSRIGIVTDDAVLGSCCGRLFRNTYSGWKALCLPLRGSVTICVLPFGI